MSNLHYLTDYSHFNSKEEMDLAAKKHVSINSNQLNNTDRAVLDMIRRYSVKYGAAHLKHQTMANSLEKSVSTVRRTIRKLETLCIIGRIPFVRRVLSGLGANIYSILPFKEKNEQREMDTPKIVESIDVPKRETTKNEKEPSFNKSLKDFNSINTSNTSHESTGNYYSRFKSHIASFTGQADQQLASRLFGIYKAHSIRQMRFEHNADKMSDFEAIGINAISITMQASKKKNIKSITGYFDGVYRGLISDMLHQVHDVYIN